MGKKRIRNRKWGRRRKWFERTLLDCYQLNEDIKEMWVSLTPISPNTNIHWILPWAHLSQENKNRVNKKK